MNTTSLCELYLKIRSNHEKQFALLKKYVHGMLKAHGGTIKIDYKTQTICDDNDIDFYDQFCASIEIDGKHETMTINLTSVSLKNDNVLEVDGVEFTDWENTWYGGMYTREDYHTYFNVAYFIDQNKPKNENKRKYHYEYAAYTDNLNYGRMFICQHRNRHSCNWMAANARKGCYVIEKVRVYD